MGHEACSVVGFPSPLSGLRLYQNAAEPLTGFTRVFTIGNTVAPPFSTSFSCLIRGKCRQILLINLVCLYNV